MDHQFFSNKISENLKNKLNMFMKSPISGIAEEEIISDLVQEKIFLLDLEIELEDFSKSSNHKDREKALRILVGLLKKYIDLTLFNEFLVSKLKDHFSIQPFAIEGLLYSFLISLPNNDLLEKLFDSDLLVNLNFSSLENENVIQFYNLIDKIILNEHLTNIVKKLEFAIFLSLKDQYNYSRVYSGLIVLNSMKRTYLERSITFDLSQNFFEFFKFHFPPSNEAYESDEPLLLAKIFINTLSLFQNRHFESLQIALINSSSSSPFVRADCFALIHSILGEVVSGDFFENIITRNLVCEIINILLQPLENISCIEDKNINESDTLIRLTVLSRLCATFYRLKIHGFFETHFDTQLSKLRFTMTCQSLVAMLKICAIFSGFNIPTVELLIKNALIYLEDFEIPQSDFNAVFVAFHDCHMLSIEKQKSILNRFKSIQTDDATFNILISTYPHIFNSNYIEFQINNLKTQKKVEHHKIVKMFQKCPLFLSIEVFKKIINSFPINENFDDISEIILSILKSCLKKSNFLKIIEFSSNHLVYIFQNIIESSKISVEIIRIFSEVLSSISSFENKEIHSVIFGFTRFDILLPNLFNTFIIKHSFIIFSLLLPSIQFNQKINTFELINVLINESTKFVLSLPLINTILEKIEIKILNLGFSEHNLEVIQVPINNFSIRIYLISLKAELIKTCINNFSLLYNSFDKILKIMVKKGFWDNEFYLDFIINEKIQPESVNKNIWSVFLQRYSMCLLDFALLNLEISTNIFDEIKCRLIYVLINKVSSQFLPTTISLNFSKVCLYFIIQVFSFVCQSLIFESNLCNSSSVFLKSLLLNSSNLSISQINEIVDAVLSHLERIRDEKSFRSFYLIQCLRIIRNKMENVSDYPHYQKVIQILRSYSTHWKRLIRMESMRCLVEYKLQLFNDNV